MVYWGLGIKKMISIVIPCYNEEASLRLLYGELKTILNELETKHEIIFVDDGSTDNTSILIQKLRKYDNTIKLVRYKTNQGKSYALQKGFNTAKGKFIITLDADLQNNPINIFNLIKKFNEGYDFVCGYRKERKDTLNKKLLSRLLCWKNIFYAYGMSSLIVARILDTWRIIDHDVM